MGGRENEGKRKREGRGKWEVAGRVYGVCGKRMRERGREREREEISGKCMMYVVRG